MRVPSNASREASPDASSGGSAQQARNGKRRDSPPGRYLVRSGSVYLFQIRLPADLGGEPARFVRIGLGPLTARQARGRAELLAALARNRFDQIRTARLHDNEDAAEGVEGAQPYFDGGSPEITMAEIKGYLKAMLSIVSQPPPPTPPHQERAFAGMRGLVALNRELAKGAAANPLIAENADYLKAQEIAKFSGADGQDPAGLAAAVQSAPIPVSPSPPAIGDNQPAPPAPVQPASAVPPQTPPAAPAGLSSAPRVEIHRDETGKIIPAFRLDRRTVARKPSALPRLSEVTEDYFATRAVKVGEDNKDLGTAKFRLGVFLDLIGDHPVDTYTGADLQAYIALMTHWPAHKRHRPAGMSPREILASNAELRFKPLKRSAFEDGYVSIVKTVIKHKVVEWDYPYPFAGVQLRYPDTAGSKESAEPLGSDRISAIFRTGVERGLLDEAMLPLLGHLTGRRLGLLVHLTGSDIREKYPGVWVAQTTGIVLTEDGVWRRVPIKTDASTTFFVLHDLLNQIGFIEWAQRQGDGFLFRQLIRLADPSKSASQYMGRLFKRAGVEGTRREVFHSLRGGNIEQMRDNKVDPRDRKLQAGHQLEDEHELYGFRAISEKRARALAHAPLQEGVDFSMFEGLDFERLARSKRTFGRRKG